MQPSEPQENNKVCKCGFWTLRKFRDASIGLLLLVVACRMAFTTSTIDLSGFNFTDLLSLILAISAIALSAAFYFKADESSRSFYNNTYHFTKEVSEILGRIEAGFGQQLAHINEGWAGLNQKIDRMPLDSINFREQEEKKKAEIEQQEAARDNIIEDLMRRAQVDGAEKQALNEQLADLQVELEQSKAQLAKLKESESESYDAYGFTQGALRVLYESIGPFVSIRMNDERLAGKFESLVKQGVIPGHIIRHMLSVGLISNGELNSTGVVFIRNLLKRFRSFVAT